MASISKLRRQLWRDFQAFGKTLRVLQHSEPMVPGSVYLLRRKCGKTSCRCNRGELHECWVLTRSEGGKIRLYSVAKEQRGALRQLTATYRLYQRSRARMVKLSSKLVQQVDLIAQQRIQRWPQPSAATPQP